MPPVDAGIIAAAVIIFNGLLWWFAQRGKAKVDPETGVLLFRHGMFLRAFSFFIAFIVPTGFTIWGVFNTLNKQEDALSFSNVIDIIGLYALFGGLGAVLIWETSRFALAVSRDGLECRSPWRGQRFIPWNQIKEISYSLINQWFVIRSTDGWKFRIHTFVPGLTQFLESCESHLPPEALAKAKAGYLRVGRSFPTG